MMTLAQSKHVNIRWIIYLHMEYSNQELVKFDLKWRMQLPDEDFKLPPPPPHKISHKTGDRDKIGTKTLKVRASYDQSSTIFERLLQYLGKIDNNELLTYTYNTANQKYIPFINSEFTTD